MNRVNYTMSPFPLSTERLAEMQDDYKHIANAIATMKSRNGQQFNYILSGCENIGDAGYVVYNNVLYNVVSNGNATADTMSIVTSTVTDVVDGVQQVLATETHIEWQEGGEISYSELRRLSVLYARQNSTMKALKTPTNSEIIMDTPILCGWRNGDLLIAGTASSTRLSSAYLLQLPVENIPYIDVLLPAKVAGEIVVATVDAETGIIRIPLPEDTSVITSISINTVIDGRYIL